MVKKTIILKLLDGVVPQRSILRKLIFVNDLQYGTDILNPIMLVDDTSLFPSHSNIKDLFEIANEEIKNIFEWCSMNKLSLFP